MRYNHLFLSATLAVVFSACVKDTKVQPQAEPEPVLTGPPPAITFNFKAMANTKVWTATTTFTNSSGEVYSVKRLNYYISNLKLKKEDGSYYLEPESYHLIQHELGATSFSIGNLPEANYTGMEFIIGVDSLRNVSGAQTGALDPGKGMFWDWNTGYKFFVMEGTYSSDNVSNQDFAMHIGGFSGKFNCLEKCSYTFNPVINAKKNSQIKVNFNTVIDEVFMNPVRMGFDDYYYNVADPGTSKTIANNYRDMLVIDKIEN